jgi:hypothetical protein
MTTKDIPREPVAAAFQSLMKQHPLPRVLIDQVPAIGDLVWAMYVHGFIAGASWNSEKEAM